MCGIFAAMTRHGISSDRCETALKLLEHRGPDGTGIWTSRDGQWTLGHTRLSIIKAHKRDGDGRPCGPDRGGVLCERLVYVGPQTVDVDMKLVL
ncbi:MAG: hypothetical protein QOD36_1675, partial [Mycobacterium sp.]|nr:hypothetical protein [Mycobacterium sp.]